MRVCVCFLLLYVYLVNGITNGEKEAEEDISRKRIIEQLTRTRTVLLDDYHLVTRQIATDVYMFRSYRTVSVVFYPVMRDVVDARFTFQSEELHLNNIGSCNPQDVIVNIKHGSYPAVNPDGYDFPKGFIDPARREDGIHTLELQSDGRNRTYAIKNPKPGNWFALVYIEWEDPRTQKLEQQGLVADCQTILYTDLQVKREDDITLIDCYSGLSVNYIALPAYYKCITVDSIEPITFNLSISETPEALSSKITLKLQALTLPTNEDNIIHCAFNPSTSTSQSITFSPHPNAWHYIHLHYTENTTNVANCESYLQSPDDEIDNHTVLELMRDDRGRFFTFDYGLPTTDLHDATSLLNVSSNEITSIKFNVNNFVDIGGSLAIEASLLMSLKYYMGYKREIKKGALLAFTEDNQYFKVVICVNIGHISIPLETGQCRYNDHVTPALFVLNSTDSDSIYDKVIIPYPDSGTWYLTFRLFCDEIVCPCRTSDNGTKYYVNSRPYVTDSVVDTTESWREGTGDCNSTVVLSVSSTSCVGGKCSNHGSCVYNSLGGLVMSVCSCSSGYGAWDCSDDSRMDSRAYMLVSILLLTLSNLVFMFSIYTAIIRLYYTEAMMYGFTMIFSTFYHACDAPSQVAYCIITGNILQFGDFYCGIMSFWVTLLAVSIINDKFRSSLQLIGAIIIALLTTWNKRSFMAFVLPVAVGVATLLVSWYLDYRKYHKWRFPRSYYRIYLPLGLILVSIGLVCFAFLQTEQNYKIVHSFWHMSVAVSVAFILPDTKRDEGVNPFVPSPNYCKLPFCRFFRGSQTPIAED